LSPIRWFRDRRNNNRKNSSYDKEALPKLSKTMIVIKFEVNHLNGILLFNIPPIPSNRIWISFFQMPQMEFSVEINCLQLFLFIDLFYLGYTTSWRISCTIL